jgi:hypothetical protein
MTYQTGVRIMLEGGDGIAVEAAAAELKARLGERFSVTARRRACGPAGLRLIGAMLVSAASSLDAGAGDLLDRLYAGFGARPEATDREGNTAE